MKKETKIRIFCDGAGQRPDGSGSGFAWLREDTGEQKTERVNGLSNNVAEYRGVIAALDAVPEKSTVEVLTDSELVFRQLRNECRILDPNLQKMAMQVIATARKRKLAFTISWIPRRQNRAGKLL